jgi:hypothetical protein
MPAKCIYIDNLNNIKCRNRALFNYEKEKGCRYCKDHVLENMVNKNNVICFIDNCIKRASYRNLENKYTCGKHKVLSGRNNIVNINHKKCQLKIDNKKVCKGRALYNFKGMDPEYCNYHKIDDMVG